MSRKPDTKMMKDVVTLGKGVETFYEKTVTRFGNSAKVDAPKMYLGRRVYVIVLRD